MEQSDSLRVVSAVHFSTCVADFDSYGIPELGYSSCWNLPYTEIARRACQDLGICLLGRGIHVLHTSQYLPLACLTRIRANRNLFHPRA